jgi:hypothetical protein
MQVCAPPMFATSYVYANLKQSLIAAVLTPLRLRLSLAKSKFTTSLAYALLILNSAFRLFVLFKGWRNTRYLNELKYT